MNPAVQLRKRERLKVLAVDHTLRHESLRASKLSQELRSHSLQQGDVAIALREPSCPHLRLCERFKDHLMIKHALFALGPEQATCFCERCTAGQPMVQVSGSPPQQYSLPLGWSHFVHRWAIRECPLPRCVNVNICKTQYSQVRILGHLLFILCLCAWSLLTCLCYSSDLNSMGTVKTKALP